MSQKRTWEGEFGAPQIGTESQIGLSRVFTEIPEEAVKWGCGWRAWERVSCPAVVEVWFWASYLVSLSFSSLRSKKITPAHKTTVKIRKEKQLKC